MDVSDQDRDVLIQRDSADLAADLDRSLEPFLRKPNGQLRRRVRTREASRLVCQVLEPFQELPQLLDPHLPKWLPVLAEAFLERLTVDRHRSRSLSTRSQLLMPLSQAICWVIYTFCKIRGEKVIVRFLNVETRYLELLLLAIEEAERRGEVGDKAKDEQQQQQHAPVSWTWHERYVVLLWLSQLLFAPFDLSTISSGDAYDLDRSFIAGLQWPEQVPGITLRVIPLATKYLASPGKERDGARALLVRLAMRRDMREVGILEALVRWALSTLRVREEAEAQTPYYCIGSLAFLAGVLGASADTSIMDAYLSDIFYTTQTISAEENTALKVINGSALARKMLIKVVRSVVTLILRKQEQSASDAEIVETSIGYLLEQLADNDTPVRFAASKALSVITLKLELDMASQVIEAVLESLNRNVLWVKNTADPSAPPSRDITAVDACEWHGLMLTLSHLLYRRAPPPENLSDIIHALLMGLSFEKRNASGGAIGTNVRDASCFGIWALARRYSTSELLRVQTQRVLIARGHDKAVSVLQVIATELVVTASLDPAGNIRRGASAALQELIGRHPDTIEEGIPVVQAVDYHTVALRSRAIHQVALQATRLSVHYGRALLEATLGWRGIGDMDANARRVAATSFGSLTVELASIAGAVPIERVNSSIGLLLSNIKALQTRQVEERHGLLLGLAAVLDHLPSLLQASGRLENSQVTLLLGEALSIIRDARDSKYRKPELVAEAASRLIMSLSPILLMHLFREQKEPAGTERNIILRSGPAIVAEGASETAATITREVDALQDHRSTQLDELVLVLNDVIHIWLDRNEPEVIDEASKASLVLLIFSPMAARANIIGGWCARIAQPKNLRNRHGNGFFHAVTRAYPLSSSAGQGAPAMTQVCEALRERWEQDIDIETRVAILDSLIDRRILKENVQHFLSVISDGLDDYTTNARGDIGSHVRLAAIKATKTIWEAQIYNENMVSAVFPRILRLAAEKLDKVRAEAQSALAMVLEPVYSESFAKLACSSKDYFSFLFTLCDDSNSQRLREPVRKCRAAFAADCMPLLLAGLVTSADTGNEDLVIETRAALASFCEGQDEANEEAPVGGESLRWVCAALVDNLKSYQGRGMDRVVVPTLEVLAFLFHAGALERRGAAELNLKQLCLFVQKAAYKTGNVRKLEACIKVYGGIASTAVDVGASAGATPTTAPMQRQMGSPSDDTTGTDATLMANVATAALDTTLEQQAPTELAQKRQAGVVEARRRLGALMLHPWPRIRGLAVDELWSLLPLPLPPQSQSSSQLTTAAAAADEEHETAACATGQQWQRESLLGIDWGKTDKAHIKRTVAGLGLG